MLTAPRDLIRARRAAAAKVVHAILTVVVAAHVGWLALHDGFSAVGMLLTIAALLSLAFVPRVPILALSVFAIAAYGMPRYEGPIMGLLRVNLLNWLALLALTGWVAWLLRSGTRPPLRHRLILAMAALLGWGGLSLTLAWHGGASLDYEPKHHPEQWLQASVLMLVAATVLDGRHRGWLFALLLCAIPLARYGVQAPGTLYLDGDVSTLSAMLIPFALVGAGTQRHKVLRLAFALAAVGLLWLVFSAQSRGAAIGLLAGLAALALGARWNRRAALLAMLLVALALALAPRHLFERFSVLWNPQASHARAGLDRATVDHRLQLWGGALRMVAERPWFGVGPGNYPARVGALVPGSEGYVAHNSMLQAAAEAGVIGAALFLMIFGGALVALRSAAMRRNNAVDPSLALALQSSLAVYLAAGLFISRHDMQLAYLLVGWAVALDVASRRATASAAA